MRRKWAGVAVVLAIAAGCGPAFISDQNIDRYDFTIVRAGSDYELSMPELYQMLADGNFLPQGGTLSADEVRNVIDSILCDTLEGLQAREIDLGEHHRYFRLYRRRYQSFLIQRYLEETVYSKVSVDSGEVVEFYQSRPDLFGVQEAVLLRQILISPLGLQYGPDSLEFRRMTAEQRDSAAETRARQIYAELAAGLPFDTAAIMYSHDNSSAEGGGLVGWTGRGRYMDPFDSVAFSMKAGDVSEPYRDKSGWHILYVEDYRETGIPDLTPDLYLTARNSLIQDKANQMAKPLQDSIASELELEYYDEVLDTNVYFIPETEWAAVVNNQDTIYFEELRTLEEGYRRQHGVSNSTVEMKKEMIQALAGYYRFVQRARAAGIDTLPDVRQEEESLRLKYARTIVTADRSVLGWKAPDSLIEVYYKDHEEEYRTATPFVLQHIILEDSLTAEFVRDQALAGQDFLELAREYYPGEPSIRVDLADLGEVRPGDVPDELLAAARRTKLGGVSHPVKTRYGYHIVKVLAKADTTGLTEARFAISAILREQHEREVFERYRDNLYQRFNVAFVGAVLPVQLPPQAERSSL